jgi:hypothetical protein
MRVPLVCFLLTLILVTPAAAGDSRSVTNNLFSSSRPRLNVKVNPRYKYLGKINHTVIVPTADRARVNRYAAESYVFVDSTGNHVNKAFYIQIRNEQTSHSVNLLGDMRVNLQSGFCQLGEQEYRCRTRVVFPTREGAVPKLIMEKGYTIPECVLTRAYTRIDSTNGNFLLILSYNEDLSRSGLDCGAWLSKDELAAEQELFLDGFERRCRDSFEIVRRGFLKDSRHKAYRDGESVMDRVMPPDDKR